MSEMETTGIGLGDAMLLCKNNDSNVNGWGGAWNNPLTFTSKV